MKAKRVALSHERGTGCSAMGEHAAQRCDCLPPTRYWRAAATFLS
jgi:hypothetical protein